MTKFVRISKPSFKMINTMMVATVLCLSDWLGTPVDRTIVFLALEEAMDPP